MATPEKKYLYAGIKGVLNFGNEIIDYATKKILKQVFDMPFDEFDSMRSDAEPGDYAFSLIPGCTSLTPDQAPGVDSLPGLGVPMLCVAANLWAKNPHPGFLIRTRVIRLGDQPEPDLRIARACEPPIGCRDPFTYETMRRAGIPALYMGCPTLLLPKDNVADDGYTLLSFGRQHYRTQVRKGQKLSRHCKAIIGICHEKGEYEQVRAAGWDLPLVTFRGDVEAYLDYFRRANMVVTGRLHGALPAIAFGKRVMYFGTRDTRTTLLDDLGVSIHGYRDIPRAGKLATDHYHLGLHKRFFHEWEHFFSLVSQRLDRP